MSEESELRTITLLSKLWDGSPVDRVRATDKEHVTLFGRSLAVHLMAQPEVATRMLGKSLYKSQGMLARFLICQPTSRIGSRVHDGSSDDPQNDSRLRRYWHALRQLLERQPTEDHDIGGLNPPCLALSPEARGLLVEAYNGIEGFMTTETLSEKYRQLAIRVEQCHCQIAILHKALQPCGTNEEFAEVASMAQNVLEPVVEPLAEASADMTLLWSSVERLEEERDRRPRQTAPAGRKSAA